MVIRDFVVKMDKGSN